MGIWLRFHEVVNLGASELEAWLQTDESLAVGFRRNGGESVGHASGRRIVSLLRKPDGDLSGDDYRHMRKVIGFIRITNKCRQCRFYLGY